jgi:hypothetical protein
METLRRRPLPESLALEGAGGLSPAGLLAGLQLAWSCFKYS